MPLISWDGKLDTTQIITEIILVSSLQPQPFQGLFGGFSHKTQISPLNPWNSVYSVCHPPTNPPTRTPNKRKKPTTKTYTKKKKKMLKKKNREISCAVGWTRVHSTPNTEGKQHSTPNIEGKQHYPVMSGCVTIPSFWQGHKTHCSNRPVPFPLVLTSRPYALQYSNITGRPFDASPENKRCISRN